MSHLLRTHYGGWRPSLPDHRRYRADTSGLTVLPEVDPRHQLPPIFDQGQLGSCTSNAAAAAFQYDSILDGKDSGLLSRLWVYYQERKLEGSLSQGDCGATGSDAFKVAKSLGVPAETDWSYDISTFAGPPPPKAVKDERHYKLTKSYVSPTASQLAFQQVLSNRQTIAFGFTVYESFESDQVAHTGIVPMPGQGEKQLGGHEVLLVGYLKSQPNYGLVRNSWGTGWGLKGYFLMPWTYILSSDLTGDWTTIQRPAGA